ncbi:arginase family protein [Desulfospira joergensenii]|uniref:arginase family protein n=1 Tax=Desulfospira joergensenii TaxID=53329 RepID=UPI0003B54E87|nr:arginase family protein [Desulfospira joergensenii]
MDCDEKYDAIQEKLQPLWTAQGFDDPLDGVMDRLDSDPACSSVHPEAWENLGSLPVPGWLGPKPGPTDRSKISTENFISFIDSDGCRKMADEAGRFVSEKILPDIPLMIGIDHSLTGGIYSVLARHYGRENLSLIIIDSHTDAVPMSALAGAIQYDVETNPSSFHDADDPFLYNRPDSYNASSFVHSLVNEGEVDFKNLYIIGVSDYPEKKSLRIKDKRIKKYTDAYTGLRRKGAKIITKKECKLSPQKIKGVLKKVSTPYVYLSIDMDIGANNALEGVRFRNWTGLDEGKIYKLADSIKEIFSNSVQLAGMDICEIDPRRAGEMQASGRDQTYEIAANLVKKIVFTQ